MSKPAPSLSKILVGLFLTFILTIRIQAAEKPNILFIAIDDQNDWIGQKTPASFLQRLEAR